MIGSVGMYEIAAQGVGIIAMAFNILSYMQKTRKSVITFQLIGASLFSVNFFMLGATVGGILNAIAAVRAIIYLNKKKFHADSPIWLIGFISLYIASYILNFTLFGKDFTLINALTEILPVIGMVAINLSYIKNDAKAVRLFGLVSSPSWLIYNIFNFAIGAIICEVLSLCSIITGIWKYDLKNKKEE